MDDGLVRVRNEICNFRYLDLFTTKTKNVVFVHE